MANASPQETSPLFVLSLEKALRVLEAFGNGQRQLGLTEIAGLCEFDKSAAQRFTHTLERLGYLEKCPKTKRFSLGKKVLDLAFNYLRGDALIEAATPALVELRRSCGERVNLSLFDGTTILYAIRQQSRREYFFSSLIGRRMPTFCTAGGRAILSRLPRAEMLDILARSKLEPLTGETVTDPELICERVEQARRQGYAMVAGESAVGELVVGAAVLDLERRPVAAVHIAGSLGEWAPADFERRFAPLAVETAQTLSRSPGTGFSGLSYHHG